MNLKDDKQLVKQIRYLKSNRLFGSVIYYIMRNRLTSENQWTKVNTRYILGFDKILGIDEVLKLFNRTHTSSFLKENSFLKMAFRWETTKQSYSFWEHINKVLSKL